MYSDYYSFHREAQHQPQPEISSLFLRVYHSRYRKSKTGWHYCFLNFGIIKKGIPLLLQDISHLAVSFSLSHDETASPRSLSFIMISPCLRLRTVHPLYKKVGLTTALDDIKYIKPKARKRWLTPPPKAPMWIRQCIASVLSFSLFIILWWCPILFSIATIERTIYNQ